MSTIVKNADAPWDEFDSVAYFEHNYRSVREDDAEILELLAAFYADLPTGLDVIDVGTGANLYPLLAAIPRARSILAWEYSASNVEWLERTLAGDLPPNWITFWDRLAASAPDLYPADGWKALPELISIEQASIFDLPPRTWDVGSMHFVAESISDSAEEFAAACRSFVGCVRPGGSIVASFMENSEGYDVGGIRFPAYPIEADALRTALGPFVTDLDVRRIGVPASPVRAGYTGMLVATAQVV